MVKVNVDNFVRAETARMFEGGLLSQTAGYNALAHVRVPTSVDNQPVIRMNRDTLYSSAIVNISGGATVSLPDVDDRYMSMMVINEDHHINRILTDPGTTTSPWKSSRPPSSGCPLGCSSIPTIPTTWPR